MKEGTNVSCIINKQHCQTKHLIYLFSLLNKKKFTLETNVFKYLSFALFFQAIQNNGHAK